MSGNKIALRIGTRSSTLAVLQAREAVDELGRLLPALSCTIVPMSSPGDDDKTVRLQDSAADFFTRYIDEAVRSGDLDCAVHSAKDLPTPVANDFDWFWLPAAQDPRDVLVVAAGKTLADLPPDPVVGISSDRRQEYCRRRFPGARLHNIRGTIEERLQQLDSGAFDVLIMAGAALLRLQLEHRIAAWIPLAELEPPAGQGHLAITYRRGDPRLRRIRQLFLHPAVLVGAGTGSAGACTVDGLDALRTCDVCLYDALAPEQLLNQLPRHARAIDVGKRGGMYTVARPAMDAMLLDSVCQGKYVVRLKGGDPGIFGRLAEEVEALEQHGIPYRVIPGVSSLLSATTGTGLLATRRGVCRGFTVITPRLAATGGDRISADIRIGLPLVLFMAVGRIREVVAQLLAEGRPATEPAALVFGAGSADEEIIASDLGGIANAVGDRERTLPGLMLVGEIAAAKYLYRQDLTALGNQRVLLTCSDDLQGVAAAAVRRFGGYPVPLPLIRLTPEATAVERLAEIDRFDWIVLTSPAAVACLLALLREHQMDIRRLPKVLVSGAGVARALREHGIVADGVPEETFSSLEMIEKAREILRPGERVLRFRSDQADQSVEQALATLGAQVCDCVLYRNTPIAYPSLPTFQSVFFASGTAVRSFIHQWGGGALSGKTVVAIGEPTAKVLAANQIPVDVMPQTSTASDSIHALAAHTIQRWLRAQ